jgi:hypothetical protein
MSDRDALMQVSISPSDSGLADLINSLEMVSRKYLPNTTRAIKVAVRTLEYTWKSYAMGSPIPGTSIRLKNVRGVYAKSIKSKINNLSGVIYSDSPYALDLEEGTEEKDLKKIIPFGPKARRGKNGPYAIVPFRHGAPTSLVAPMPSVMYKKIMSKIKEGEFKKSRVRKEVQQTQNVQGQMVNRNTYAWGSRVKKAPDFPNLEGMVVFDVPSSPGESRSSFVTFRIVSANKPKVSKARRGWENSWVVPSREGLHITKHVVANTKEVITELIRAGISHDLSP